MRIGVTQSRTRLPNLFEIYCLAVSLAGSAYILGKLPAVTFDHTSGNEHFVGPFKGGTRAAACLIDGRLVDAFIFSPLALLFVAVLTLGVAHYLLLVLGAGRRVHFAMNGKEQVWLKVSAVMAILVGWVYALAAHGSLALF